MKKHICILTATRAEYGLLKPIIFKLKEIDRFEVEVVVTGAHLSPEFGLTYQEIENDGIAIGDRIEILLSSDTPSSISKSMGLALIGFADYFSRTKPDLLVVLGDRYETLAVCCAAMNQRIPIAHLYGGETTEGAVDEAIRHAITKMSYLHFTSTETYRNRVIQLGEDPGRVFNVGAIGIENIRKLNLLDRDSLSESLGFSLDKPFAVVTYHPVTLDQNTVQDQISALLTVCARHSELNYLFTKANADSQGRIINRTIDDFVNQHKNCVAYDSLGNLRYLSALKHCTLVMGNSSSGLIEAPSFGIPVINIGDRQKGRIQADSVINCLPEADDIEKALCLAVSEKTQVRARQVRNPYEKDDVAASIIRQIALALDNQNINLKKKFHDIDLNSSPTTIDH